MAKPSPPQELLRTPQNIEAEKALIASVLLDPSTITVANEILIPDDFFNVLHRHIFQAMVSLSELNAPIDIPNITVHVGQLKIFEEAGGVRYLMALPQTLPSALNIRNYAERVRNASLLRRVIEIADNARTKAQLPMENVSDFLTGLNKEIFELSLNDAQRPYFSMREVMKSTFDMLEELHANKDRTPGVSSGFYDLDARTAGFRPGTLTILAARPAMGKTALALNFMTNAAVDHKTPTAFFSLEMTKEELCSRIFCARGKLRGDRMRDGRFTEEEWSRLLGAMQEITNAPIFVNETAALSITKLQAIARRLKEEQKIGLIVIDYLQLMHGSQPNAVSREQEISEISRTLKSLAKELSIPVIALSQLNRGVESRPDKRPMLSDLRESGAIEQDADIIMFIYRDDYYNKDSTEKGVSEIIIAKQRSGPTGTVKLKWMGEFTLFQNLEPDHDHHF